ncbi:hydrogen gas-evolving membrane-bound hydrogenase subunit E [Halorhabdus sp. BNX81]|uniref:hydrogen gas-evolving membrane-bound hydrogenase subunit E n=1 Tax=Halorhabdus sp. BNX81 TaxID=2980181 RepID=UPI0023DD3BC3|nr:hydrogen gas-evolving membrane-bound hydrogenase subunit E [Halorhabdus sp. BNX81]WEL21093.1 Multisubunit Na /H antiporter, MnhA subunit [Halorhabdus sp. BNX81]
MQSPSQSVLLVVLALPFLAAAIAPLVYRLAGERVAYFGAAVAAVAFGLIGTQYGTEGVVSIPWIPSLDVSLALYVDGLSLLLGFVVSGIGILIFTYSGGYMHDEPGKAKFYTTLLVFMGAMLGVAFAADLLALFVFWELTSVSSFILIGHYQDDPDSQYAARKAMVITVAGGLFLLIAFLLLHTVSADVMGTATFRLAGEGSMIENAGAMREGLRSAGLFVPVLALLAVGAAAKSAQVPLHIWLPNAMEAPTPVSAFLHSATMVKAGVYLIGRFRPLLGSAEWELLFASLGLLTMTVGAMLAIKADDIKELLAYSTASHLGLIVAGFGIQYKYGAETGAFHILNHALFKAALFLVAGIVAHEAGSRLLSELGGLWRDLPITAAVAVVAALGMAGLPPFNGFYSKELLFEATFHAAEHAGGLWWLLPVVAVFGSIFTFLYSIKFLSLFFGDRPDALEHVHSPPLPMLAPPVILATLAGVIGLGGIGGTLGIHFWPLEAFINRILESVGASNPHFGYYLPTSLTPAAGMSAITVGVGAVAYPYYDRLAAVVDRLASIKPLSPNWYYDGIMNWLDRTGVVAERLHTGRIRTYASWLLVGVAALTIGGYVAAGVVLPALSSITLAAPIVIVLGVAVVAALAVTIAPSHVAGVLTLSILGFMVAIFYILANAPDLALTQLVIETLVLVLFLLVLNKLPAFYGDLKRRQIVTDTIVSGVVGVTVFLTVLVSTAATPGKPIYTYFLERGGVPTEHGQWLLEWGGGSNIVNVILVDFRAFDTMGEISVVAMAALSIITMIAMRQRGETQ